ncbi:MAG: GGDEF domain-containing protein [Vitreoscilla sp.]|nr:GGDEF domain-containing protein [Vitreoscilla sp.]
MIVDVQVPWLRRLLFALLAISAIALVWNHWGMERRLQLVPNGRFAVTSTDDRGGDGGSSVSSVRRQGSRLVLDCDIGLRYQFPFCELLFTLAEPPDGLDLSRYDTLHLRISSQGKDAQAPVRLFIRQFNPRYSRPGDVGSLKVHEIAFVPAHYPNGLSFALDRVGVASWWTDEHPLPMELSGHERDRVVTISLSTPGKAEAGMHTLVVERFELIGKWVSPGNLSTGLVAMWVLAILAYLAADTWATRRQLLHSSRLQASLRRANESLRNQKESLAQQAHHDALTGALNRHGLGEVLVGQARHADDGMFPMSLVFIDIDHFKQINDKAGHQVGDEVIRQVADIVRAQVQRSDLLARWGGEEFLLLCRRTAAAEGARVAERLRTELAGAAWPGGLKVTCSFGVAEWRRGQDFSEAIHSADAAMYSAKRAGRNRVVRGA